MFEIATFTYKSKNNLLPLPFQNYFSNTCNVHKQLARGSTNYNFFLPICRTRKLQRSIKYQGSKVWNSLHWSTKKIFFIGASNIRAVLEYIWGADSKNDGGFFASALVFEIRYTAHICLELQGVKKVPDRFLNLM